MYQETDRAVGVHYREASQRARELRGIANAGTSTASKDSDSSSEDDDANSFGQQPIKRRRHPGMSIRLPSSTTGGEDAVVLKHSYRQATPRYVGQIITRHCHQLALPLSG